MASNRERDFEVFMEAIQLSHEEQMAFLDRVGAEDESLRHSVEALLRANACSGEFMEKPPTGSFNWAKSTVSAGEKPGDRVDKYRLLQQIGEGGCGIVFLAEQETPVHRRVALKIIKPGMDTKSVIARFEAERQALALMDHPNIAQIYDAGTTESGRPYFVMELVRGLKITEYADQHSLTAQERLRLLAQVCEAIQHAHQKGIIHRDLKPSNILVTTDVEGKPAPKVIDFGIAKATTGQPLTDKTIFTGFEMLIGTPAYMSPEQAELTSVDVDTRTDIYSLGVLLYELLTGSTPFDTQQLLKAGLDEVRRVIRTQDPVRPSTRLSSMSQADLTIISKSRHAEPMTLVRALRGDLDWIAMKALEKDRARRYATANGLAVDIQRFLANEPISARPPSKFYKLRKAAQRNKLVFASVGTILLFLVGSLIIVSASLAKEKQSSAASREATKLVTEMMLRAGPATDAGLDTKMMKYILGKTAEGLGKEPIPAVVEAQLRDLVGKIYEQLGEFPQAEEMERAALKIRQRTLGPKSLETAQSLNDLGLALMAQRKLPEAEKCHAEALAIRRQLLGLENTNTATSLNDLGAVYRDEGKLKEAEATARQALGIRIRQLGGRDNMDVADSLRNLSMILGFQSRWAESEKLSREVLAIRTKLLGPEHIYVASALNDLSWAVNGGGNSEEAEKLVARAFVIRGKHLEPTHPDISRSLDSLGQMLATRGDLPASDALLKVALSIQRNVLGDANQFTLETLCSLGRVLDGEGKAKEAETVYREALDVSNKLGNNANPDRLMALRGLGDALEHQGKWSEAEAIWRESLPLWRERGGKEEWQSMFTLRRLGLALEAQHNWSAAETVHREALSISSKKGDEDPEALDDLGKLARVLANEKKYAEANELLDKVLTATFVTQGASANLLSVRVDLLGRRGRWQEARKAAELALENQPSDHYRYHILANLLAMTHDRPAYEDLCRKLIARFGNPVNPYIAERVAQDCLLLPNSGVDLTLIDKLADISVTLGSGDALIYFQACKAMSNYRLGRFTEAIEWADKALNSPFSEPPAKGKAFAVLAMANWQLGQKSAAREALANGDAASPKFSPEHGTEDLGGSWVAWIMARISLDEAAELIKPDP